MRVKASVVAVVLSFVLCATLQANTYGSVEPLANPAVLDTSALRDQPLRVREAFANRLLQCGVVSRVIEALSSTRAITTINDLNTHFAVGAGGFAGSTNPSFVYTVIDDGPNAASIGDIKVLTDSLGYVMSQASAFLLDADNTSSFDFPANYVVLNFDTPPSIARSAALFRTVGRIDSELFATDTSGYTQYGRAYLSLQSDVPDAQFIAGYVRAAAEFGVEYTPLDQRRTLALPGRRRLPWQRLDPEPARRGIPGAHSSAEPPGARTHSGVPPSRHGGGPPQARGPRQAVAVRSGFVRLPIARPGFACLLSANVTSVPRRAPYDSHTPPLPRAGCQWCRVVRGRTLAGLRRFRGARPCRHRPLRLPGPHAGLPRLGGRAARPHREVDRDVPARVAGARARHGERREDRMGTDRALRGRHLRRGPAPADRAAGHRPGHQRDRRDQRRRDRRAAEVSLVVPLPRAGRGRYRALGPLRTDHGQTRGGPARRFRAAAAGVRIEHAPRHHARRRGGTPGAHSRRGRLQGVQDPARHAGWPQP